jgi:hypothetical protein
MKKRYKRAEFSWAALLALIVWWHTSPAEALESWANRGLNETSAPVVITQLNQVAATAPQVYIVSPRPEEVIADTNVAVQLQVSGTPIFKNSQFGLGPHLHLLLDRVPTISIYDLSTPITLSNLSPGTHTLQVLANKPWHESWKNPQAFAQVTFYVLAKSTDSPNAQAPQLISVQPTEVGAEPWLLDFYVANAPSHVDGQHPLRQVADWRVRATVNEQSFEVNRDQPVYLQGLRPGVNVLKLEYLNAQGQVSDSAVRVVRYQPNGSDGLSRLVRNELSIDQALTLFDPQSRSVKAQVELSDTKIPSTQQPTMPWNQEVPSMPQANQGMQANSGIQRNPVMEGNAGAQSNPGIYGNSGMQSNPVMQGNSGMQSNPVMQGNSGMYGNSGMQSNSGMYGNSGMQSNPEMYGNSGMQNNPLMQSNSGAQSNSGMYGNSGIQSNPVMQSNSGAQSNPGIYGNSGIQSNPVMQGNSGAQSNSGMYGNSGMQSNPVMQGNSGAQSNSVIYGNSGMQSNPVMQGNSGAQSNPGVYGNSGMQSNPVMQGNSGMYGNSGIQGNPGMYDNSRAQSNPGMYDNSRAQSNPGMYDNSRAQSNPGMYDNSRAQSNPGMYDNSRAQSNPGMYGNSGAQNNPGMYSNSINPVTPQSALPAPSRTFFNSAEISQLKLPQTIAGDSSKAIAEGASETIAKGASETITEGASETIGSLPLVNPEHPEITTNPQNLSPNIRSKDIALLPPIQPQSSTPNPTTTEPKEPITALAPEPIAPPVTKQPQKIIITPKVLPSPATKSTTATSPFTDKIASNPTAPITADPKFLDPKPLPLATNEKVVDFKAIGQELLHNTSVKIKHFTNQIPPLANSWNEKFRHWLSDRMAAMRANPSPTTSIESAQPTPVQK